MGTRSSPCRIKPSLRCHSTKLFAGFFIYRVFPPRMINHLKAGTGHDALFFQLPDATPMPPILCFYSHTTQGICRLPTAFHQRIPRRPIGLPSRGCRAQQGRESQPRNGLKSQRTNHARGKSVQTRERQTRGLPRPRPLKPHPRCLFNRKRFLMSSPRSKHTAILLH